MKKQFIIFLSLTMVFLLPYSSSASNFEINAITPTQGAIGDEVKITLPYITDMFPGCYSTGIYATHVLSAKVFFNNTEATLKQPISGYASGGGTQVYALVPSGASTGKIKVELNCIGNDVMGNPNNYNTIINSLSDFTVLLPSAQDELSVRQQYLQQAKIDQAWNYSHGSSEVVVAVIDDGVYTGHPDLDSNMWINLNEIEGNGKDDDNNGYIDDRWGWDFVSNSKNMTTLGTHGTMVAGIIGSESNNNTGITGINWNVKLMPIITCDDIGCNDEAIKKGIRYAVDNGADIINLSLGGEVFDYTDDYNEVIKYAFDRNVLVVIAAGNGDLEGDIGRNLDITKVSPVCNDAGQNMVLGVGAVDANNQLTSWSNYGGCADIYAPGENIVSTAVPAYSTLNGFYDSADGTSFSTPIVSGVAALIKAKYPTIKNTAIRDRIINNSDYQNGLRIVNAYRAISQTFSDNEKISNTIPIGQEINLITTIDNQLSGRLRGKILLQVESHGEAWYIPPTESKRYYMKDGPTAYEMLRQFGLGITNADLEKIPIEGSDQIGNYSLVNRLKGYILLQVEEHGEAWYVSPDDGKRYYMRNGEEAYRIMKILSLGITNDDLGKIDIGEIE